MIGFSQSLVAHFVGLLLTVVSTGGLLGAIAAAQIVSSAGVMVYNVNQLSFRLAITPDRLLGRMNATMRSFVRGFCRGSE